MDSMRRMAALFTLACALWVAVPAASADVRGAPNDPRHSDGRSNSTNWSGFDVLGTGATHVIGTWTQPLALCSARENSWSSPWVGIDGDGSNTVEQIGTDTDCVNGSPSYYAWYEMYPKSLVQLPMTVVAGHSYTGEVTYSGGAYVMRLTDNSVSPPVTKTVTLTGRKTRNASVEWIMEGPSRGLLTDFNFVDFSAAAGSINSQSGALASLSRPQSITMVDGKGNTRAQPGSLNADSSFRVTWSHN